VSLSLLRLLNLNGTNHKNSMALTCDDGSWDKMCEMGKKQKPGQILCNMNGKVFMTTLLGLKKDGRVYQDYEM
jgi:hypothetical protein